VAIFKRISLTKLLCVRRPSCQSIITTILNEDREKGLPTSIRLVKDLRLIYGYYYYV